MKDRDAQPASWRAGSDSIVSTDHGRRNFINAGFGVSIVALWRGESTFARENKMRNSKKTNQLPSMLTYEDLRSVSPALEHYTKGPLLDGVWKRPGLSPRDRSVVTVAALIARIQTIEMPFHFGLALDNGVKPRELSEIITHLAFDAGWANAMSAVPRALAAPCACASRPQPGDR
jgi:4-carboxymuconolactone decarboxylase